ncbi:MAG: hypothetical protein ACP5XB_32155, partial [Isosphaeraceae bacterium]
MRMLFRTASFLLVCFPMSIRAEVTLDLAAARLKLDDRGVVASLTFADGTRWPSGNAPVFALETAGGTVFPRSVKQVGEAIEVAFEDGSTARFQVRREHSLALFRLKSLAPRGPVRRFHLFRLDAPLSAHLGATLNAAFTDRWTAAVMAAEPNV